MNQRDHLENSKRVAVIGGGISGLAAALKLLEFDSRLKVSLLEASDSLGGLLQTETISGFCSELGADGFITDVPWALDLCRRIGFLEELIPTNDTYRCTYVVRRGELQPIPSGFTVMVPSRLGPVFTSPILSLRGKIRLAGERLVPCRREKGDESLAAFVRRRLGCEVFERLVQPLASGIYMGDPETISMQAAFPRFVQMESNHGSLIRGARMFPRRPESIRADGESGLRYSLFVTPRKGLASLIEAVALCLPDGVIQKNQRVDQIFPRPLGSWELTLSHQGTGHSSVQTFDAVIVAVPALPAAQLLTPAHQKLAHELRSIRHTGCVIVVAAFDREQIGHRLDGFGFVVPQVENLTIQACTFSSIKYVQRAPAGSVLLRIFLGGACRPDLIDLADVTLEKSALQDLGRLLGISSGPRWCRIVRWPEVMPQYELGHLDRVDRIEAAIETLPNLQLAGNAYRGVGIPHCIHSGERAAEKIARQLQLPST